MITDKDLKPCPFCGGEASLEYDGARVGNHTQSCIVVCLDCGCSLESNEEGEFSGNRWNTRIESAEQARKEASERGISFMQERLVPGVFTDIMLDEMRAAILSTVNESFTVANVSTDAEKLAIAVKALEEIATLNTGTWDNPVPFSVLWHDSRRISTDALKEIQ